MQPSFKDVSINPQSKEIQNVVALQNRQFKRRLSHEQTEARAFAL